MKRFRTALTIVLMAGFAQVAAQAYPERPIRLVVPFAAGGGTDFVARTIVPGMSTSLGQSVVVDNRGGANGVIGSEIVARAPADGYTLLLGAAGTLVVAPHLSDKLPFDVPKDFKPISLVGVSPFVVTVHPSVPARSIGELIALAKAKPGQLTFGSSGTGGAPHLATELFKKMAAVDMVHVPYKGLAPAVNDLLGGQIQLLFADVGLVLPHIRAGKVRALAISGQRRFSLLPDLPTVAEAGVPGYDAGTWYGLLAPAGTPDAIVERLSREANAALAGAEVRQQFGAQGVEAAGTTPAGFRRHIETESAKWRDLIRETKIRLE